MKLKTINIKGKEYVPVNERIAFFNETYQNGRILTEVSYDGEYVRAKATVTPDLAKPERSFTGHAEEDRNQGNINLTNATENAETSAIGRALGLMGIGVLEAVASADEIAHAIHKQEAAKARAYESLPPMTMTRLDFGKKKILCDVAGCGGEMKLRKGRNGDFYGCSNYPTCTNTQEASKENSKKKEVHPTA